MFFGAAPVCVSSIHLEFLSTAFPLSHHRIILSVCVVFWQNYTFKWFRKAHGTLTFVLNHILLFVLLHNSHWQMSAQLFPVHTTLYEKHQPISAVWGIQASTAINNSFNLTFVTASAFGAKLRNFIAEHNIMVCDLFIVGPWIFKHYGKIEGAKSDLKQEKWLSRELNALQFKIDQTLAT